MKPKPLRTTGQFEISTGRTVLQKTNILGWTCEQKEITGRKVWFGYRRFGKKVRSMYIGTDISKAVDKIKQKEDRLKNQQNPL